MEKIIDFIGNNYSWFLTITIILLFALIGYIYDSKRNKTDLLKKAENEMEEISLENIVVPEGKSLSEHVSKSKNINQETKTVELTDETILNENNNTQDTANNN
ncbi:MAG: hypothetical protein IJY87_01170 [Bacilli bacterium]|nr:hypothetical protein [Bacilli bacterium]MBQ8901661.1 hypothetical protein [Bacilli bacterium]